MKPFSLLIKPVSSDCNMSCRYCFYLEKSLLYPEKKFHRMSEATLENLISSYMKTLQHCYAFGWQGGEPTLMGVEFFKKVIELQKKYGKSGSLVTNGLQTNATLINEDFAKHLSEYRFLLGVSIDGPLYIHDHYRKFSGGQGTFKRVIKSIEILRSNNVEFNILVLVNNFNVEKAKELYRFLVDNSFYFHQYIPCVEFDSQGNLQPFSINGEQWGNFLIELFDQWYPQDIYKVSIRLFDSILNYQLYHKPTICHMENNCNQYVVVEYNGDVYPCDFFVRADLKLGNINENSWEEILNSLIYLNFGKIKSDYNFICSSCPYLSYCYGDCPKCRGFNINDSQKLSNLCSGWKMFYNRNLKIFKKIADNFKHNNF
ncbi:MAG: anaerobic sulfatase maturase [Candidatus Humimicrobiaceae bacterium]